MSEELVNAMMITTKVESALHSEFPQDFYILELKLFNKKHVFIKKKLKKKIENKIIKKYFLT